MERLRFSTRETKLITTLINFHMRPTQMGHPPSKHAIYRYFRDAGDAGIDILYLSLADHLATRGPGLIPEYWKEHCETVRVVLEEHFRKKAEPPPKLLDGNDLINVFGMKPGPALGKLLEKVREAQAAGELTTRQQALDYVRGRVEANRQKRHSRPRSLRARSLRSG
jgi:poly(A) polymerase